MLGQWVVCPIDLATHRDILKIVGFVKPITKIVSDIENLIFFLEQFYQTYLASPKSIHN